MQLLVLFDIDNTLIGINSGNLPQRRAMNRAFEQVHGFPDAFENIAFTGGIDLPLMMEVYRNRGLTPEDSEALPDMSGFKEAYFDNLERNLDDWTEGEVCPGVPELLEALSSDGRVQLGLVTGNFREAAFIKLNRYGLDGYFQEGGFGGEHMEKQQVVAGHRTLPGGLRTGLRSGRGCPGRRSASDIEAGNANGVDTIALCTGFYSAEDLGKCNPSHVLPDLSDTGEVLGLIFGVSRS